MNRNTFALRLRLMGGALVLGLAGLSASASAQAQPEKPKYGGALSIGTN